MGSRLAVAPQSRDFREVEVELDAGYAGQSAVVHGQERRTGKGKGEEMEVASKRKKRKAGRR